MMKIAWTSEESQKKHSNTKIGKETGSPYRGGAATQNKIVKTQSCQDKMLGAGKRIFRSGGPRRKPRLAHRQSTDPVPRPGCLPSPPLPLTCGPGAVDCCD